MRIGLCGGGQLAQMLSLAGHPLGLRCVAYAQDAGDPACAVGAFELGGWDDDDALDRFAARVDLVTFEFENVPRRAVERLAARVPVRPSIEALDTAADRVSEKSLFRRLGIGTAPFEAVDSQADLVRALASIGLPAVLKTRRMGYDGKGQKVLRAPGDVQSAFAELGGHPCILEGFVPFRRELSVVGVRGLNGEVAVYPLFENRHRDGVLRVSTSPALCSPSLEAEAHRAMRAVLEALDYVGVLAVELFEIEGGLLANEMAPRVHNSAHLTSEGHETSQFENHLRAVAGWPLGSTRPLGHAGMVNLLGAVPDAATGSGAGSVLAVEGAHVHLYGKAPRPGRKVGHVTVRAADAAARDAALARVVALLGA